MRVGLLAASAPKRNAVGNALSEKAAFFQERGADVRIFLQAGMPAAYGGQFDPRSADPRMWSFLSSADLVIAEYAQYYPLLHVLPLLAGGKPRLVVDYHG